MLTKQTSQNADAFYQNLVIRHKLAAGQVSTNHVTVNLADINKLVAGQVSVDNATVNVADIVKLTSNEATLNTADVTNLTVTGSLVLNQNLVATVESISALRSFVRDNFEAVVVTGYYAANDGGGGVYQYSASSTAVDNGGSVIVATDGSHWLLVSTGQYNVKQWGATGNGVTNDTVAIQAALNAAHADTSSVVITVLFPPGSYVVNNVQVPTNLILQGYGATIQAPTTGNTNYLFTLVGGTNSKLVIEGFSFVSNGMTTTGGDAGLPCCAIYRSVSQTTITNVYIRNNTFLYQNSVSTVIAVGVNNINGFFLNGNYASGYTGDTFNVNSTNALIEGNIVLNGKDGAYAVNNGSTAVIVGNYAYRCSLGVGCGPVTTVGNTTYYMEVCGNTFDGCDNGVNFGYFGYAGQQGPTNWVISGNCFRRCRSVGVTLNEAGAYTNINGTISGNTFTGGGSPLYNGVASTGYHDIFCGNVSNITISGNTMSNLDASAPGSSYCIQTDGCSNITISGNTMSTSSGAAYAINVFITNACDTIDVVSNSFIASVVGVQIGQVSPADHNQNVNVASNQFVGNTAQAVYALNNPFYVQIVSNMVNSSSANFMFDLSSAVDYFAICSNMIRTSGGNAITVNTNTLHYNVSYNTVFGSAVTTPVTGGTHQTTGNF